MRLLAIDPGNVESAWVVIDGDCRLVHFDKRDNDDLITWLPRWAETERFDLVVIEMVASYGMPVGAEVFETCVWIGRFQQALDGVSTRLVKRLDVRIHHCRSPKAKDSNVRQALVDRFAAGQPNHGKGTKKAPGWFHGFSADLWQAYALAVFAADTMEA